MPKVKIYLLDFGIIVNNGNKYTYFNYSDELSFMRMINSLGSKSNIACSVYNLDKKYGVKDASIKKIGYMYDKIEILMDRKTKYKLLEKEQINQPYQILQLVDKLPETQKSQVMEIL